MLHAGDQQSKPQPKLAMIFKGKGLFLKKEKHMYHPDVDVYAQKKATADIPFSVAYINRTMHQHLADEASESPWCLFADNLGAQKSKAFVGAVQKLNGEICFGPPQKTEGWQPIDTGHVGAPSLTKYKIILCKFQHDHF